MLLLSLLLSAVFAAPVPVPQEADEKVSKFGQYDGYSEARFDGWATESFYVEMRDGVQLAVDVTRPTAGGELASEPVPAVWTHSRYHRNPSALSRVFGGGGGGVQSMVDAQSDLQRLVRHGYAVASVGVRGSGASYGRYEGLFSPSETDDAREIIEWLAAQPWCDGNIGMFGGSYLGITQYMAASEKPEALKAIFPNVAAFDMYDVVYPGGVYRDDMIQHWGTLTRRLDTEWEAPPVDRDEDKALLKAAIAEHEDNWDVLDQYRLARFRDHSTDEMSWLEWGAPSAVLEQIRAAKVPCYHWNGWYDIFITDSALWTANYDGPQKLGVGAWSHAGMPDGKLMSERARLTAIEQHRWFDYWLKGIDNGIADEPPIHYAVMQDPGEWTWASSDAWPPPEAETMRYYFAAGPSGSVESVNDGVLSPSAPEDEVAFDAYAIDYDTTTGTTTRWDNAVGAAPVMVYPDLAANDALALTYTTPALESDLAVVGHPVATLQVSCAAEDVDVYVLLEEVDPQGRSRYVTEGVLRASQRKLADSPWDNLGLPYQRCFEADPEPLVPDEPTELVLDLHPTATVFNAGNRVRITIMGADKDNAEQPPVEEGTKIRLHRGAALASSVDLPVVPSGD